MITRTVLHAIAFVLLTLALLALLAVAGPVVAWLFVS